MWGHDASHPHPAWVTTRCCRGGKSQPSFCRMTVLWLCVHISIFSIRHKSIQDVDPVASQMKKSVLVSDWLTSIAGFQIYSLVRRIAIFHPLSLEISFRVFFFDKGFAQEQPFQIRLGVFGKTRLRIVWYIDLNFSLSFAFAATSYWFGLLSCSCRHTLSTPNRQLSTPFFVTCIRAWARIRGRRRLPSHHSLLTHKPL